MVVLNLALSMRLIVKLLLLACVIGAFFHFRTNIQELNRIAAEHKTLATPYFLNGTWHFSGDPKIRAVEIKSFRRDHPDLKVGTISTKPRSREVEITFDQIVPSPRS